MNHKYKYILVLLLVLQAAGLKAQQEPQYTQYMFNMMSVNPAYAGTQEALNALLLSRQQWVGLDGAPASYTFAMHTPVKERKIGLGVSVIADRIGPVTNSYINFNYAYRVQVFEKMTLSMGLKAGIYNYHVGLSDITVNDLDQSFSDDYGKNLQPNLGAGAFLFGDRFYVGLSVPKFFHTNIGQETVSSEENSLRRHYFITAGTILKINENWKFKPSLLNKLVQGAPPSLDITAQALYRDRIWLGTSYRVGDAISFLFEFMVNRQLMLGYSYDYTTSALSDVSHGSHEILISYDFVGFSGNKVKSPRYF